MLYTKGSRITKTAGELCKITASQILPNKYTASDDIHFVDKKEIIGSPLTD